MERCSLPSDISIIRSFARAFQRQSPRLGRRRVPAVLSTKRWSPGRRGQTTVPLTRRARLRPSRARRRRDVFFAVVCASPRRRRARARDDDARMRRGGANPRGAAARIARARRARARRDHGGGARMGERYFKRSFRRARRTDGVVCVRESDDNVDDQRRITRAVAKMALH